MSVTSALDAAMHRFGVLVGEVPEPPVSSRLFIASDGHELCLWEGDRDDPAPRCVERESDVDPIVWALILRSLHVEISHDTEPIRLPGPTLADGLAAVAGQAGRAS